VKIPKYLFKKFEEDMGYQYDNEYKSKGRKGVEEWMS